jgi:phage host-nuclease inhibitor protein Gam
MKKTKRTRIKLPLVTLATRADAEAAMRDLANTANNARKITAMRDAAVLAINEKYEPALAECAQAIATKSDALRAWAEANPSEFPKDRKSIQFPGGLLGFRTGTPKLVLLNRKWTWKTATQAVLNNLLPFIRREPEIDKEALIAQREDPVIAETLPKCGLKVTQEETFYIEPALTDTDARQSLKSEAA